MWAVRDATGKCDVFLVRGCVVVTGGLHVVLLWLDGGD